MIQKQCDERDTLLFTSFMKSSYWMNHKWWSSRVTWWKYSYLAKEDSDWHCNWQQQQLIAEICDIVYENLLALTSSWTSLCPSLPGIALEFYQYCKSGCVQGQDLKSFLLKVLKNSNFGSSSHYKQQLWKAMKGLGSEDCLNPFVPHSQWAFDLWDTCLLPGGIHGTASQGIHCISIIGCCFWLLAQVIYTWLI